MTLDPQAQALLALAERSTRPPLESLDAPAARIQYAEMVAAVCGDPPDGVAARDIEIPTLAGHVGARLYRPDDVDDPLPVLIYFHGGGFVIGSLDTHDVPCRQLALEAKCSVVSVDYRLAPEHPFPAAVDDAWAATRWVADHAAELGGDATRLAVGGDSAGGNLAAVVCHLAKRAGGPALVYQVLIYPSTDLTGSMPSYASMGEGYRLTAELMDWFMGHYFRGGGDRRALEASPLFAEDFSGLPPGVVAVAEYDPLVDEGRAYADKLRAAGVHAELADFEGMIHGFLTMGGFMDATATLIETCAWSLRGPFWDDAH